MPTETRHHTTGNLPAAALLAGGAGFLDTFAYMRLAPIFVANMSGNLVRLGMGIGRADARLALGTCTAVAAFVIGALATTMYLHRHVRSGTMPPPPTVPLLVEAALLAVVAVWLGVAHLDDGASVRFEALPLLAIAACAMGAQGVALRRVGETAVSTTYGTGALVRLGEKLALAAGRAERPSEVRRRVTIAVLGTVLACYVAGAALGAALHGHAPALLLAAAAPPVAALLVARDRDADRDVAPVG